MNNLTLNKKQDNQGSKGFITFNENLIVTSMDVEALRLLGLAADNKPDGQQLETIFGKEVFLVLLKHINSVIQDDSFVQHDLMISGGPSGWIRFLIYRIGENNYAMLLLDITTEKQVESALEESKEQFSILYETAAKLTTMKHPKELLDSLFTRLSDALDLDLYVNYLWDKKSEKLHLVNYHGLDLETARKLSTLAKGEAVCGCVARDMSKIVLENVDQISDQRVLSLRSTGIKAYACEPLISFGELVGTLSFGSKKRTSFTSEELDLIHTICQQVTVVLDRMNVVQEMKLNTHSLEVTNLHLKQNERKLRDIFDGAQVGIIIMDNDGGIVDTNKAACFILGITEDRLKKLQIKDFVSNSNKVSLKEHWERLVSFGKAQDNEYIITRPDLTERIVSFSASKNIYCGHHLIIFHDITLHKNIEQSLIIERNEAEKANKTKTNFLAMISHELRTPLNSIIGFGQILDSDENDPLSAKQKSRLAKIQNSSKHLLQLINNILELVRIDSQPDTVQENVKRISVKSAILDSIQLVQSNAYEKSIYIHIEEGLEDISIKVDPIRFQQVMVNLLANAIKYNKQKGIVTLYWRADGSYLAIFVKDSGIGIPKDEQEKIFEPFYRIYHSDYNIEGTGIGLTLVKQNVLEMKGTVGVSSMENIGSTFWIKIPV